MKIHEDIIQGSADWGIIRSGKVTASEMDSLVSPLGAVRDGKGVKTYIMQKIAEAWIGGPLPAVQGVWDMEQGQILEKLARPAFTIETGLEVREVGFITGDNELVGCSPDGLIVGQEIGLEIKSPHVERHIQFLLDGVLPLEYVAQVQASMFVTGYREWYFCSFRRNFPLLVLKVARDETYQAAIAEAVAGFQTAFKAGLAKLVKINGGMPSPRNRGNVPFPNLEAGKNERIDYKV